ncbi:GNAT family N-acetyltransferase [Amycolatopsis cihanbeyliensis]|uniref:Ribosomal protein S18 acetylase RimI-like enzyme n=1 Tax=Amycolatopsis cihanbeyliensis TaxID=1128664 RepID=A0A542DG46_AMYCI|nr:N-acetyltransferase [Amycolatopsis cihanbeyliensis]TQJ02059.1 ribosomal protein S18 acetylase RimI-like enzyme [Amycolatopsis cihanbeyliensis]
MTAAYSGSSGYQRVVELSGDEFRARLAEALDLYVDAMRYPAGTAEQRAPMWLTHALREGWRCMAALDSTGTMLGLAYGYQGNPGQWWHEQVRRGLAERDERAVQGWLADYFELTEIHVRPDHQARGIGEDLLRRLVEGVPNRHVLLSTPEGPSRAWKLYRRLGFVDVLRKYYFAGDPRPFAILGRELPLG